MSRHDDFEDLGRMLNNVMKKTAKDVTRKVAHEVRKAVDTATEPFETSTERDPDTSPPPVRRPYTPPPQPKPSARESYAPPRQAPPPPAKLPRGTSVPGILMIIFGSIGAAMFALFSLAFLMIALASSLETVPFLVGGLVLAAVDALCVGMILKGAGLCRRAKRLQKYKAIAGNAKFCPVAVLASGTGQEISFVAKDLKKMIRSGLLPDCHLDQQETTLILDFETYRLYLQTEQERKAREQEAAKRAEEARRERGKKPPKTGNEELDAVIRDGQRIVRQIRDANAAIPGVLISERLDQLEEVTGKIFEYVEQHPEKLPEIRKFMNYYLPTTLKLLDSYIEFDSQPVQGENITVAKREIEGTLATINSAFENLLDRLFQHDVLDVSTDISALETMLAQEGLTGTDFKSGPSLH